MRINEAVRRMHPPRYTTSQAAQLVGRDADTLKRWRNDGVYKPRVEPVEFGALKVIVYDDDDIKAMRKLAKEIKPGRKPGEQNGNTQPA